MADEMAEGGQATQTSRWKELWTTEDYWAIWLGVLVVLAGLLIFLPRPPDGMQSTIDESNVVLAREDAAAPFRTIAWFEASDAKAGVKGTSQGFAKAIANFLAKPHGWKSNPLESLVMSEARAAEKKAAAWTNYDSAKEKTLAALAGARTAENRARAAGFGDDALNEEARTAINGWRNERYFESTAKKKTSASSYNLLPGLIGLCVIFALFFGLPLRFLGIPPLKFMAGFLFVFAFAVLAYILAGQSTMKEYGVGYAAWAILFGMIISNTVGTPKWVLPAVQTEYFIKAGLVILGAEILFGKILIIGLPGIFVAWLVTPVVLVTGFIVGDKIIKIPSKTLNVTIAAAASVCGVSAAIATAAACKAKKEELTLAVGLSLIFTVLMMIFMPLFISAVGMDEILGGAWMGGTIDATGAVAAAGAFLGDKALYVAATIKMIQNVMIGAIAFFVALYWVARVERKGESRVGLMEIWVRFPKFVLGFIGVSVVCSVVQAVLGDDVGYTLLDQGVIRGFTRIIRGWFFCLAFVSIGLATNFRELASHFKGGKPFIHYVFTQGFNVVFTLFIAWIMFNVIFPEIAARI